MKKRDKRIVLLGFMLAALFFGLLVFVITDAGDATWYGWGIDSENQVYIGSPTEILVYRDGEVAKAVDIPDFRTYCFTVSEEDRILLSNSLTVYVMDLNGTVLSFGSDDGCALYNKLQRIPDVVDKKAETYRLRRTWGRRVIENAAGTVLYASSPVNTVGYVVSAVLLLVLLTFGVYTLCHICGRKDREAVMAEYTKG